MSTVVERIETILTSEYSVQNFVEFVREVFAGMELVAPDRLRKEYSNFSSHIAASSHIGNYSFPDGKKLIVFAVQLLNKTYVEGSRSTQRSYAKKLIENANADAAFIAFYTEGDPKWRVSFVRLDYEMKIENGRLKTAENMTPAKRYSYLVGQDEPCHTAIDRFRKFITDATDHQEHPTLDDLEEAFSVEAVTNEFFALYCEKFHQLREHLERSEDFRIEAEQHNFTSAQFAKKLMGQIVFLYFLQKKGWLGVTAWPNTLTEKEYKNAFYAKGVKSRQLIPIVYQKQEDGLYHVSARGLNSLSDDDETVLAQCVKGQPWGTGPRNFMRRLFQFSQRRNANFFDDYLEPLFYNALNVNRGEQGYDPVLHCRIPFLSGGLFEPIDGYEWEHNNFAIPNEVFSNRQGDNARTGDGILDIFDRYNFTMSEDEPLEREVAIDPEMLGKVFENLLEVNDRKSKGAFYTPREIVHYMCQESLISYLTTALGISESAIRDFILYGDFMKDEDTIKERRQGNGGMFISEELYKIGSDGSVIVNHLVELDNALANVRIADPAVGSGAFPLGMLNEIVRARQNISAYYAITMNAYDTRMMYSMERSPHNIKYNTIKNCIFAADIEPSAVDIAQLRLWLSLVIDDEINPDATSILEGHRNPLPLPNLECNILCGNSLMDVFEGIPLINYSKLIGTQTDNQQTNLFQAGFDSILPRLIESQDRLYSCEDTGKKKELLEEIAELRDMIIMSQLKGRASSEIIKEYYDTKKKASKPFVLWQLDFARVFKEKGGFDIVIGNPPYVSAPTQLADATLAKNREEIIACKRYKCLNSKWDLYVPFMELGIQLLHENGNFAMIVPYPLTNQIYGKKLRDMFISEYDLVEIVDLKDVKVFQATVQNCIPFVKKSPTRGETIISHMQDGHIRHMYIQPHDQLVQDPKTLVWNLTKEERSKARFSHLKVLGDYCYLSYGLRPNSDEKTAKGEFVKKDLISTELDGIPRREYVEAKDTEPYKINRVRYLEYGTERSPGRLTRPTFPELYQHPKLMFNVLGDLRGMIDTEGVLLHNHSLIACVLWKDLKGVENTSISSSIKKFSRFSRQDMEKMSEEISLPYILGIMNSRYAAGLLANERSGDYHIYPEHLRNIPLPNASKLEQEKIAEIVNAIIYKAKENQDYSQEQELVNTLVERLYEKE